MKPEFHSFKEVLEGKTSFLLVAHEEPDGDAIGAILSMARFLSDRGKEVRFASKDQAPELFKFMKGADKLSHDFLIGDYDVIILIDNGDLKRTGFAERILAAKKSGKIIINIDHHPQNDIWKMATINIADSSCSSTSEIIFDLFVYFNYYIDSEIATNLLGGIYYDTGGFQHSNTSKKVLEIASNLMRSGASLKKVSRSVSQSRSVSMLKLWGIALSRLKVIKKFGLAFTFITQDDLEKSGAKEDEISGLVNMINSTAEAGASLLIYQNNNGNIKGSLRTEKDEIDVSRLAKYLGGGGHRKAAGFSLSGKIKQNGQGWVIE